MARRRWCARAASRRADRRQSGIPASAGRRRAARRRASAHLRGRCRPRRRRPLVGARRPHAGAVRRGLRAREPARALARHARHLSRAVGVDRLAPFFQAFQARPVAAQPAGRWPRLPAHARADERDLFRARLSRALSRLPAGRGRRPDGARRRRLHPHRLRPAARRGAAAPARCRFRRSAGAQCALAARRAGPGAGGARRQGRHRQRARRRRRRRRALLAFLPALARGRARRRT